MSLTVMDYLKIAVFTAVFFMLFKFALNQTQELQHFAEHFRERVNNGPCTTASSLLGSAQLG